MEVVDIYTPVETQNAVAVETEIPLNMSIYDVDLRRLRRDFAREPIVFGTDMLEQRKLGLGQGIGSTIFVA